MNTATKSESTALATATEPTTLRVTKQSSGIAELILDPGHLKNMMAVAEIMASGISTVPKHLQKSFGDCLAVVMQAVQWGMNPFAVAQKTHVVNGALGYEAQLVHAVLEATGAIDGTFSYEHKSDGAALQTRVGATCAGDAQITWGEWLASSSVTTKNSPLWKTNPKQQMGYLQVKNWARAFKPAALLGVYTTDELNDNPPRNMGTIKAEQPQPSEALMQAAETTANKGVAAYQKFWKDAGQDNRKLLAGEHDRLKAHAIEADKTRTVDNSAGSPAAEPADNPEVGAEAAKTDAAKTDAPIVTYAAVMEKLIKAKNQDALDVAADWIGEVADPAQRSELSTKYEEFKAKMEAV
jgi:hypothetical protein